MERNRTPKFRAYHKEYGMRDVIGLHWQKEKGRLDVILANGIESPIRTPYEKVSLTQWTRLGFRTVSDIDGDRYFYSLVSDEIEVIGNMYENKELLRGDETWEW